MYDWNAKNLFRQTFGQFQKSGLIRKSAHLKPPPPHTHSTFILKPLFNILLRPLMRKFRYLGRQKMLDQNFSQFEQFLEQILKVCFF